MSLACPSCGFLTIQDNFYGTYDICPVCNWEDDKLQLANPACKGGANHISLIESQKLIIKKLAVDLKEYKGFVRDVKWRPLNKTEIERFTEEKKTQHWMNRGIISTDEVYWIQSKNILKYSR